MTLEDMKRVFGIFSIVGGFLIALAQLWLQFDSQSFIAAYFHLVGLVSIAIGLMAFILFNINLLEGLDFLVLLYYPSVYISGSVIIGSKLSFILIS